MQLETQVDGMGPPPQPSPFHGEGESGTCHGEGEGEALRRYVEYVRGAVERAPDGYTRMIRLLVLALAEGEAQRIAHRGPAARKGTG